MGTWVLRVSRNAVVKSSKGILNSALPGHTVQGGGWPPGSPYLLFILIRMPALVLNLHEDLLQLLLCPADEFVGSCSFPVKTTKQN